MGFSFHFSSLHPATYIELYVCWPIEISYLNFRSVLVLPEKAGSAQTHKSMSFIWIVWSTLSFSHVVVHLFFPCWSRAEIKNTVHMIIPKLRINYFKLDQQCTQQVLRAYRPNIYTVVFGLLLLESIPKLALSWFNVLSGPEQAW